MPEQQAWSAVSVWHNLHRTPLRLSLSPSLSPSYFLDLLHFPQRLPFLLSLFPSPSQTATYLSYSPSPLCSYPTSPLTHLFPSLTLRLDHPSPCPAILFVHFILCSFRFCDPLLCRTRRCHHFYFSTSPLRQFFPLSSLPPIWLFILSYCFQREGEKGKERRKERAKERWRQRKEKKKSESTREERETSKGGETKSSLLSPWWEKMSEGAIIKLEFFNTVKNGALTAHRQCKGQAPTTHGEPPN